MTYTFNSIEEIEKYYNAETNTYEIGDEEYGFFDVVFNFDINIPQKNISAYSIVAKNIKCKKIMCDYLIANDIDCDNIKVYNVIKAENIDCGEITTPVIQAANICATNIECALLTAGDVIVENILECGEYSKHPKIGTVLCDYISAPKMVVDYLVADKIKAADCLYATIICYNEFTYSGKLKGKSKFSAITMLKGVVKKV